MTCDYDFELDPDDFLDFGVDWAPWLAENNNDEIATHQFIMPVGLTVSDEDFDETFALGWFSGGEVGVVYPVVSRIITTNNPPRKKDQTIFFSVGEN